MAHKYKKTKGCIAVKHIFSLLISSPHIHVFTCEVNCQGGWIMKTNTNDCYAIWVGH